MPPDIHLAEYCAMSPDREGVADRCGRVANLGSAVASLQEYCLNNEQSKLTPHESQIYWHAPYTWRKAPVPVAVH